jgi:type 1 fimbriae regulatory protein FimB/type 1 fimbriae regulatory protein FimE
MTAQVLALPARKRAVITKRTVTGAGQGRREEKDLRDRPWLTSDEVGRLLKAANESRYGLRDRAMILLAYRHGLRVSELVNLRWAQVVSLARESRASLTVERLKGSISGTHPLEPDEVSLLRKLRDAAPDAVYLFTNERGDQCTAAGFRKTLTRIAAAAGLEALKVHPHMLRHSAGQELVDKMPLGMLADYLGHAQIQNTRRYSRTDGERFRGIWRTPRRHK